MKCTYCQRDTIATKSSDHHDLKRTRDHVIPRSKGGLDIACNRVVACGRCNQVKGNMMPDQWTAFMAANPEWWMPRRKNLKQAKRAVEQDSDDYCIIAGQVYAKNVPFGPPIRRRKARRPHLADRQGPLVCPVITMVAEFFYLRRYPQVDRWAQQQGETHA